MKGPILNEMQRGIVEDYFNLRVDSFLNALAGACQDDNQKMVCFYTVDSISSVKKSHFLNLVHKYYPLEEHAAVRESLENIYNLAQGTIDEEHPLMVSACDRRLNSNMTQADMEAAKQECAEITKQNITDWLTEHNASQFLPNKSFLKGAIPNTKSATIISRM